MLHIDTGSVLVFEPCHEVGKYGKNSVADGGYKNHPRKERHPSKKKNNNY